jgi:ATP-dependent DNA ligase
LAIGIIWALAADEDIPPTKAKARFFEPMLLLPPTFLAEGEDWEYELLDGYDATAFKSNDRVHLRSRNDKDFAVRYPRSPAPDTQSEVCITMILRFGLLTPISRCRWQSFW